jgi:glutaredoxin
MKILIKCIRNLLGCIIMSIDLVTRGSKLKRTQEQQTQVNKELESLSLYQHFACPFCTKTRRAMHKLNLPIQMRSVTQGSAPRAELLEGGGKVTVPCLRIEENGKVNWMYESSDIISYLEKRFS